MPETQSASTIRALTTLQFHWGGLFSGRPADSAIHLVRVSGYGTPGPTLCGIDRFDKHGPGWSVGGGLTGPNIVRTACAPCAAEAGRLFPSLPIEGIHRDVFRAVG